MASVEYTEFLPEVLPLAPGTPHPVALNALRNAAIEFCTRTLAWTERQPAVSVTRDSFPLTLTAPTGARVATILTVKVNGVPIEPITGLDLDTSAIDLDGLIGVVSAYYQPNPETLQLVKLPEVAVSMKLNVAYAPMRTSTGIVGFIYENYLETIAAGALFRLTSDPKYQAAFESGVRDAAVSAQLSFTRATMQVDLSGAR